MSGDCFPTPREGASIGQPVRILSPGVEATS